MKKFLSVIISALFIIPLLSGCGDDRVVLNVYNVGDYINEDVIDMFEAEYPNIHINYETYYSNEEMYVKLAKGNSSYDVVFPSDYMVERMIGEGMLHKINFDNIPNIENIGKEYMYLDYDPKREYSVPYMWGTMGILYNTQMVNEPVTSWKILWDEKYKDNIFMLNSERDTIGITLKMLGYSMNSTDDYELNKAKEALIAQKDIVLAYSGDEVKDKIINEEGAMTIAWSGDAFYCMELNENLAYAVPEEGSNLWFDSMVIPAVSEHKEEAELFINFMSRPDVAKLNADYIGYSTPNIAAREMLDDEIKNDPLRYPDLSKLSNMDVFRYSEELVQKQSDIWLQVKISD